MKKTLFSLLGFCAILSSCSGIDALRELETYSDYVVCSYDNGTQTAYASDYAKYSVKGDLTTGYYMLTVEDVPLYDGAVFRSDTLSCLNQYFETTQADSEDSTTVRYTYFVKESSTYQSGDLNLNELRFGWLSTIAWMTGEAEDGRYSLWSLPPTVKAYANRNTVVGPNGTLYENAISPLYKVTFNTSASTVTVKAAGVKYPVDDTDPSKTVSIASLTWENLPIEYTDFGFTSSVAEFTPTITGKIGTTEIQSGDFTIKNFHLYFPADYDTQRYATFTLTQKSTGLQLKVTTYLDYYLNGITY